MSFNFLLLMIIGVLFGLPIVIYLLFYAGSKGLCEGKINAWGTFLRKETTEEDHEKSE